MHRAYRQNAHHIGLPARPRVDHLSASRPLARRRLSLVGMELPGSFLGSVHTPAHGHLVDVAAHDRRTLRPAVLPASARPRHHLVRIGAGARVDLLLDDGARHSSSPASRVTEVWVGTGARLRLVDRTSGGGPVDLVGIRLQPGATLELIGVRGAVARSAVVSVHLAPGANCSVTWVQQSQSPAAVDLRVTGASARHRFMLSAPLGPGTSTVRLNASADRLGVPRCGSVRMGSPDPSQAAGWSNLLPAGPRTVAPAPVALPPVPPSLRSTLKRRAKL